MSAAILEAAIQTSQAIVKVDKRLPPILTLKHLSYLSDTAYLDLREYVERQESDPYRVFSITKRPGKDKKARFRIICVPEPALLKVQRWLATNVLRWATSQIHNASTAYAPGCSIEMAASPHCGCRWLIKVDISKFFESVTEISVFRAFRKLGYQPLVAFELARLCTRLGKPSLSRMRAKWRIKPRVSNKIPSYHSYRMGHLPQGAPTSPMLANLTMYEADLDLEALANSKGLIYSRYADDLSFSTDAAEFDRSGAAKIIHEIYGILGKHGFSPNFSKTQIVPPRARKVVLGLLVDGDRPRLTRQFKSSMRMHLYYLKLHGPVRHASTRGFSAVAGLRNHLFGLAAYAKQIDPEYGVKVQSKLEAVAWPL